MSYGARLLKIQKKCRRFFANKLNWTTRIPSQSMYSQVGSNANIGSTLPSFNAVISWDERRGRQANLQQ